MRYIVKASKMDPHEPFSAPFCHTVYDGSDFKKAKRTFLMYTAFGGVSFESLRD